MLVEPQRWATLDYTSIVTPNVSGELSWVVERASAAHGLLLWFDAELADGIGFSNVPGAPELIYGQAFFPLQEPVALEKGDTVAVQLRADLVDDDYVWRWDTQVMDGDDASCVKARFRQSTFYGAPLSLNNLKKREAGFVPQRTETAEIDQLVLSMLDGHTSLGEIAAALTVRFPKHFARQPDALTRAADLAERYSR
jgi:protein arginine N-methyltransferase 1